MKTILFGAAVAALATAGAASAGTVNSSYQAGGIFGSSNLSQKIRITTPGPGVDGVYSAGMYHLTSPEIGDFLAFCVDLAQFMKNPTEYTMKPDLFANPVVTSISKLFSSALGGAGLADVIDTSVEAAGLQVALWEVVYDNGAFDLTSGNFSMSENAAVQNQAQTYLNGLPGAASGAYNMTFLYSDTRQDIVTVAPVPLPAAGLLFGFALAGLGIAGRRRKTA